MSFYCGCRQVVRPELPKLVFAGSSPVTRSIENQRQWNTRIVF